MDEGDGNMSICIELLGDEESYVLGKLLLLRLSTDEETAQGEIAALISLTSRANDALVCFLYI